MKKLTRLVLGRKFSEGVEMTSADGEVVAIVRAENNRSGGGIRLVISAPPTIKIERVGGVGERGYSD